MPTDIHTVSGSATENLLLRDFPLWHQQAKEDRALFSFELEITARCNNRCRHCYINLPEKDETAIKQELTTDEILAIAKKAASLGALWCLITGGEPLLRPDFPEIYIGLKKLGFLVSLFTNATLINESHIRLFRKYPPRSLEVTVYGVTEKTYEAVTRRKGSFSEFMEGMDLLLEGRVNVSLKTVVIRSNVEELTAISSYCRKRSAEPFRFDPLLHLRLDRNPKKNREIILERLSPEDIASVEHSDAIRLAALRKQCTTLPGELETNDVPSLFFCRAGLEECTVGWDGNLRLCNSLYHPRMMFDLRKGSLTDAWRNFIPSIRAMRPSARSFDRSCANCRLLSLCMWCPAHAFLESGHTEHPVQYFCNVAKERERVGVRDQS
jgi:radical SAM protein with 4Fe4S-binding SPASM domain